MCLEQDRKRLERVADAKRRRVAGVGHKAEDGCREHGLLRPERRVRAALHQAKQAALIDLQEQQLVEEAAAERGRARGLLRRLRNHPRGRAQVVGALVGHHLLPHLDDLLPQRGRAGRRRRRGAAASEQERQHFAWIWPPVTVAGGQL